MKMTIDNEKIEIPVEVFGSFNPGRNDTFSPSAGQWYPGNPAQVEIDSVILGDGQNRIDIFKYLPETIIGQLREMLAEKAMQDVDLRTKI